jgi:hypothetical protein
MTDTAAVTDPATPEPRLHHILSNGITLACCASWEAFGLAAEFHHGRDRHFSDKTHFLPMEDPTLMARLIDEVAPLPVA